MDSGTFKKIFDRYYDNIRNFLYYKSGDIEVAEDLIQDVFLKLWENRKRIREESVGGYLYTIASNLLKNHYRRNEITFRFINTMVKEEEKETPEYMLEVKEFDERLQAVLAAMPEKSREVFLMHRIDGLTYREIAERLELSVKAIEKRMQKALLFLEQYLDQRI